MMQGRRHEQQQPPGEIQFQYFLPRPQMPATPPPLCLTDAPPLCLTDAPQQAVKHEHMDAPEQAIKHEQTDSAVASPSSSCKPTHGTGDSWTVPQGGTAGTHKPLTMSDITQRIQAKFDNKQGQDEYEHDDDVAEPDAKKVNTEKTVRRPTRRI